MKIAISLVGVTGDGTTVYTKGSIAAPGPKGRDWFHMKEVIMSQVINCWEGHDISLYLTTYEHSDVDNMLAFYKPKKAKILNFQNSYMQRTYMESLQQLVDEDVDFVVSIRPDIFTFKKLTEYNIDFSKFNFYHRQDTLWHLESELDYEVALETSKLHMQYCMVNDSMFLFPKHMLNTFIEATDSLWNDPRFPGWDFSTMHNVWIHLRKLLNYEQLNYMIPGVPRFANANIEQTSKGIDFKDQYTVGNPSEYFLCRNADDNLEPYNKEQDWKQFVAVMRQRLSI